MAVVLALILALARPAHGQVAETIPEADEEVEVFETAGDDFALAPDFAADPAPVFSEPARADRRMASPGLYSAEPDIARCEPGTLRNDARANFVNALNAERARHGLAPVAYDAELLAGRQLSSAQWAKEHRRACRRLGGVRGEQIMALN